MMQGNNTQNGDKKPALSWSQPSVASNNTQKPVEKPQTPTASKVEAKQNTNTTPTTHWKKRAGILVMGAVLGLSLGWIWSANRTDDTTLAGDTDTASATEGPSIPTLTTPATFASSELLVPATQPAGFSVTLTKVSVARPTWVVVYEDRNGQLGNALGAAYVVPGRSVSTVELLRATTAGKTYIVGARVDDGDKVFSLQGDSAVLGTDGSYALARFTTQ